MCALYKKNCLYKRYALCHFLECTNRYIFADIFTLTRFTLWFF
uniref:Uncharacterized protein n=1 Tax=Arundo donax TaxID=35708 RepID=A0A0A9T2B0_ARUDO